MTEHSLPDKEGMLARHYHDMSAALTWGRDCPLTDCPFCGADGEYTMEAARKAAARHNMTAMKEVLAR